MRKELLDDAKTYGDERRSPLVERTEAKALSETELVPSEPVTVVLSKQGWVRSARGHEVDGAGLSYKTGDAFKDSAPGRSNQQAVFIDSTGRSYSLPAHTLPSARGQGEPLSGRLTPPAGASFEYVLMPADEQHYIMASDAGYGFIVKGEDMQAKNKAGKALLTVPAGAKVMPPKPVCNMDDSLLAVTSNDGRLLLFPVSALPQLSKGKGNKMLGIPTDRASKREEWVVDFVILPVGASLQIESGRRTLTLKSSDLEHYRGERGRRGNKLPRGFQRVDALSVV